MAENGKDTMTIQCANPDCRIATDGRCMEGFADTASCPHFGRTVPASEAAPSTVGAHARPGIPLPPSTTLAVADAERVLVDRLARVIAIVGPQDAGKTSIIAGLYDKFQKGPVHSVAFSRSLTLHSFEQACHDSRAASRRVAPHMERTLRGEVRFYHLDLEDKSAGVSAAILLGDRAGEEYFETRNEPDTANEFPELRRADTITVLADGAKLLHSGFRHNVKADVRLTLQAFVDAGAIRPWQRLAVVLTKLDEVRSSHEAGERAQADFDNIAQAVRAAFGAHFAKIESFRVAASPKSGTATRGEGLEDLLRFWMAPALRYEPSESPRATINSSRAFGRLQRVGKEIDSNG